MKNKIIHFVFIVNDVKCTSGFQSYFLLKQWFQFRNVIYKAAFLLFGSSKPVLWAIFQLIYLRESARENIPGVSSVQYILARSLPEFRFS